MQIFPEKWQNTYKKLKKRKKTFLRIKMPKNVKIRIQNSLTKLTTTLFDMFFVRLKPCQIRENKTYIRKNPVLIDNSFII